MDGYKGSNMSIPGVRLALELASHVSATAARSLQSGRARYESLRRTTSTRRRDNRQMQRGHGFVERQLEIRFRPRFLKTEDFA